MARLTYSNRQNLPKKSFAVPSKAPGPGSYPIEDAAHARNALARASQFASPADQAKVRTAVANRYPGIMQRSTMGSPPMKPSDVNRGYRTDGGGGSSSKMSYMAKGSHVCDPNCGGK